MKKRSIGLRLEEETIIKTEKLLKELKEKGYQDISLSEFVRQSIEKWTYFYENIEKGNSLLILQTQGMDSKELMEFVEDIKKLQEKTDSMKLKILYTSVLNEMSFNIPRIIEISKKQAIEELIKKIEEK